MREIVAHTRDDVMDAFGREPRCLSFAVGSCNHTVSIAVQRDAWHRDHWLSGQLTLQGFVIRISRCTTQTMAVGMDYDINVIRIIK